MKNIIERICTELKLQSILKILNTMGIRYIYKNNETVQLLFISGLGTFRYDKYGNITSHRD